MYILITMAYTIDKTISKLAEATVYSQYSLIEFFWAIPKPKTIILKRGIKKQSLQENETNNKRKSV